MSWSPFGVSLFINAIEIRMQCHLSTQFNAFMLNIVYLIIFAELTLNPPEGIVAGPISEDNFFEWEALIQ